MNEREDIERAERERREAEYMRKAEEGIDS